MIYRTRNIPKIIQSEALKLWAISYCSITYGIVTNTRVSIFTFYAFILEREDVSLHQAGWRDAVT